MPWSLNDAKQRFDAIKFHAGLMIKVEQASKAFYSSLCFFLDDVIRLETAPRELLEQAEVAELFAGFIEARDYFFSTLGEWLADSLGIEAVWGIARSVAADEEREVDEPDSFDVISHILMFVAFEPYVLEHAPELPAKIDALIDFVLAYPREFCFARQTVQKRVDFENPHAISDRMGEVVDRLLTLPHHSEFYPDEDEGEE
jgi:hypothetical protein